jgi:hypothetical protein
MLEFLKVEFLLVSRWVEDVPECMWVGLRRETCDGREKARPEAISGQTASIGRIPRFRKGLRRGYFGALGALLALTAEDRVPRYVRGFRRESMRESGQLASWEGAEAGEAVEVAALGRRRCNGSPIQPFRQKK